MVEFNSDDHYIYYCRQESLRRNGVALIIQKRDLNAVLGCCKYLKQHLFWVLVLKGLVGFHRTVQLQLLQHY